ncbi:MAG: class I SAM-dependent methyltransferase [Parcubacteria group bacterium]|nr:class I SAM-dependent methyltransferase [Parcubacteria group bacterium]
MSDKLSEVKNIYSFWGKHPYLYAAQDYVTFLGRPKFIRKKAVESLQLQKGSAVLEVACGTGRNFPYLIEAIGDAGLPAQAGHLVGFDYSQEMLEAAQKSCERNGWSNIKLIQGDAGLLDVGDVKFDGVLTVLGISAIPEWEQALRRCRKVLRPGGRIVVCDAKLFDGALRILNPITKTVYSNLAAWDPSKNIPEKMKELFGNVRVEYFNLGTFFIAASVNH